MNAGLDFALAQVRDRDLVIESLREQLTKAQRRAGEAHRKNSSLEAKLAEVGKELEELRKGDT